MSEALAEAVTPDEACALNEAAFDDGLDAPSDLADGPPRREGRTGSFFPREPRSLEEAGISGGELEALILKYLLNMGISSGRGIADQLKLPFSVVQPALHALKAQFRLGYRSASAVSDYEYELTESGLERAQRAHERCTYFGAAPVPLEEYFESVRQQSVRLAKPRIGDVRRALDDLLLPATILSQIGEALNAGRGMFLYGPPGNGKTSIAERVVRGLGEELWIPRTITVTGEMIRLFDANHHQRLSQPEDQGWLSEGRYDRRWVRIRRPTVVVGGELTMEHLEVTFNPATGISEAPVHLKSNGGALVIDDFGRQRTSITELLNRWIVPLEKGHDYLTLSTGRQVQIPFDQLLVFATNLAPNDLVDEAFLRRIPYKIEITGPTDEEFTEAVRIEAERLGFPPAPQAVPYLLQRHFRPHSRPIRYCFARDLLMQVKNHCEFHELPPQISPRTLDVAVQNYFAGL